MSSRPKTVKILNAVYVIEYVTAEDVDLEEDLGVCLADRLTIKIKKSMRKQLIRNVLWHEVLHALYWWYGLQVGDDEERTVSMIATGSYHVLLDNPALVKYLFDK